MFEKRKPDFGDDEKSQFIEAIVGVLEVQLILVRSRSLVSDKGVVNRKAVGYIYGFIDAALNRIGQDIKDKSVSVPIVYQVIRNLFPCEEEKCTQFLIDNVGQDDTVLLGVMCGGQQYTDFMHPDKKTPPMGLSRYLLQEQR
jgi:hypothetical protein